MTKPQEKDWRALFNAWATSARHGSAIADCHDETLAPLVLRAASAVACPVVAVAPTLSMAEEIGSASGFWAHLFAQSPEAIVLPEAADASRHIPDDEARRAKTLQSALSGRRALFICDPLAAISPLPRPSSFSDSRIELRVGTAISPSELCRRLVELDYDDEFQACVPGEFARRGGIVDVFSPAHDRPARVEFFGDEVESIRLFSPDSQRTLSLADSYCATPRCAPISGLKDAPAIFTDYFPQTPHLIVIYPTRCLTQADTFLGADGARRWTHLISQWPEGRITLLLDPVESSDRPDAEPARALPPMDGLALKSRTDTLRHGDIHLNQMVAGQIRMWLDLGRMVVAAVPDSDAAEHVRHWCAEWGVNPGCVTTVELPLRCGILLPDAGLALLGEFDIFLVGRGKAAAPPIQEMRSAARARDAVETADLDEGDYAVHFSHGVCLYRGLVEIESAGRRFEALELEFDDDIIVHTPVWQAHLVGKYFGARKDIPALSKIGGTRWSKVKAEAASGARSLAAEMLRIQAFRENGEGHAFPADGRQQTFFERAFPFQDTPDQARSALEVKADMELAKPMDRLLCGDVGYGKTEIAMRAAFKTVMDGRQAAILVPTTILAQQHFYNFKERFAEWPVIIECLSRFKTKAEQRDVLSRLEEGKVDIVIGTHRLIQEDVSFARLGLLVIDEEQRFGVAQKERLKRMRATVDILTMTATPIPRTLHLSMAGLRDLSTINTAPNLRMPVQTIVCQPDERVVANAITRELERGGQCYYLHNRVRTIEAVKDRLQALVPSARLAVAHGQMPEGKLEDVISNFIDGCSDVLVCTTIIESGVDIPNVNTIIVDRADRFGLAELYQLRGRVGRWTRQAYAYLLLPKDNIVTGDARERLAAVRKFTQLGAGFKLALKDLEIRGAGNILGAEQSGNIGNVGFELYCQLLRSAVSTLKGRPSEMSVREVDFHFDFIDFGQPGDPSRPSAVLPKEYVHSERLRIDFYKRLFTLSRPDEADEILEELRDRFGPPPKEVVRLTDIARIRVLTAMAGFTSVSIRNRMVYLEGGRKGLHLVNGRLPTLAAGDPDSALQGAERILDAIVNPPTMDHCPKRP